LDIIQISLVKLEAIIFIGFSVLQAKLCNVMLSYLGNFQLWFLVSKIQFPDNLWFPDSGFQIPDFILGHLPSSQNKLRKIASELVTADRLLEG